MVFPVDVRRRWYGTARKCFVDRADLGSALLYISEGAEESLVEAMCPESKLFERAQSLYRAKRSHRDKASPPSASKFFSSYAIGEAGSHSLGSTVCKRWMLKGIRGNDKVDLYDLNTAVLIKPRTIEGDPPDINSIVPVSLFEDGQWQNEYTLPRGLLAEAFNNWVSELSTSPGAADKCVRPDYRRTALGQRLGRFISQQAEILTQPMEPAPSSLKTPTRHTA